jgi:Holliday junction resolvase
LEADGYVVVRSAGSRQIDLIAAKMGRIRLIEVKSGGGRVDSGQAGDLERIKAAFGVSHVEVWSYPPRSKHPRITFI